MIEQNKLIRSFGRIKSRGIKENNQSLLDNLLPKFLIKTREDKKINSEKLFNNKEIHLEIGFGYGTSIAERAKKNPNIGFIGCEVYINGIINLLKNINENNIENIKIFDKDARIFLENLENESLDKIFVLFPDPWPKKRHQKRRIINQNFLDIIHTKLKTNGILFFASDIENYVQWTLDSIIENKKFKPTFNNLNECEQEPEWWIKTKYQKKSIREGRVSRFLEFKKI